MTEYTPPIDHLSVADLNYMVGAILAVGGQMLGPEFIPKVVAAAEQMRIERDVASSYDPG